jgi:RecA-family ATPase
MESNMQFTEANKGNTIMRATEHLVFEPLIHTLVERGSVGMIVAPAKAKKSMLALNLVFSLLTKKNFIGLPVSSDKAKPDKIVYINLELTKTALGVRMRAMNKHYSATSKQLENVVFLTAHEFTNDQPLVDTKTQEVNKEPFQNLAETAKAWGATVLIIDPLYYVVGEENDNVLMTAVIREFGKLREELNATVFVVHHTSKGHKDWSDPFLAGRGASSLAGAFEFVLGIEPRQDNEAKLHHGSRNYASVDPFSIRFDANTLTWKSADESTSDSIVDKIMKDLDTMPMVDFYKKSQLSKVKADQLIASCKTYSRTKGSAKQKAAITRKL